MSQRVDLYSEALTSKSTQPHNIKTQQHPTVHVRGPAHQLRWETVNLWWCCSAENRGAFLRHKEDNETIVCQDHNTK